MSETIQQVNAQDPAPQEKPDKDGNGFAIAALLVGIIAMSISFIPISTTWPSSLRLLRWDSRSPRS